MIQQIKQCKSYFKLYKKYENKSLELSNTAIEFRDKVDEILCSLLEKFILNKVFKDKQGTVSLHGILRDKIKLFFQDITIPEPLHKLLENHNIEFYKFQEYYSLNISQSERVKESETAYKNIYNIEIEQCPFNPKENTVFDLIDKYDIEIIVDEINFKISYLEEVIKKLKSYDKAK